MLSFKKKLQGRPFGCTFEYIVKMSLNVSFSEEDVVVEGMINNNKINIIIYVSG